MVFRDRTQEFVGIVQAQQSRNIQRVVNIRDPKRVKQIQSHSEFMARAGTIGKSIASTYAKLEKLTVLAKEKSLFDDRTAEINELTFMIKGDLQSLNLQIAQLQGMSKEQQKKVKGKHLNQHSTNLVVSLQSRLADMSTNFKKALETRTENLKKAKSRREEFSESVPLLPLVATSNDGARSLLLEEELAEREQNQSLLGGGGGGQMTSQLLLYDESDSILQQRAETMQNIESTVVELGGIFQQLAHMVKEQEETVDRIDSNILDVGLNVDMAHNELLKYFQSVTRNRALMLKIFGALILFFMFFVFFMS